MLKKGKSVYTGEFGNEGAGGQSFLKYNWKAENTYRFLLHAEPSSDNYTTYTAYFFAPELNEWQLIASFKRPQTQTYIKRPHSFLENFIPDSGDKTRMALFTNQWIYTTQNKWEPLNSATFTNCGFFNNFTSPKRTFFTPPVIVPNVSIVDFGKIP